MSELVMEDRYRRAALRTGVAGPALRAAAVLAGFFGVLGGWAATAPLTGAAIAPGVVRALENRQAVQHPTGGVVAAIRVRDGDLAAAGQVLLSLDTTEVDAASAMLQAQLDLALVTAARLIAERDGDPRIALPADIIRRIAQPEVAELVSVQKLVLETRGVAARGEQAMLDQRVAQLELQQSAHLGHIDSLERQLALIRREAAGVRDLHSRGHAPLTRVVALERQIAALEGELSARHAALASAREEVRLTRLDQAQRRNDRAQEVAAELAEQGARIRDILPKLNAALEVRRRADLRAPKAGRVVDLAVFTVGGVVQPGARVLDIVPQQSELVVEAELDPTDIARVAIGQAAKVRIPALPRRLEELDGRVGLVSADRSVPAQGERAFYRLRIDVVPPTGVSLTSGMAATVTIPTEERTVLDYLLVPLRDRLAGAMRER